MTNVAIIAAIIWIAVAGYAVGAWATKNVLHGWWSVMPWRRKWIHWGTALWPLAWILIAVLVPFVKLSEIIRKPYR